MTSEVLWITTAAQMGMGFVLPFALTFVAIPLESFIQTFRHVAILVVMGLMDLLVVALRLAGNLAWQAGIVLLHVYDLVIFALCGWNELRRADGRVAKRRTDLPLKR